MENRSQCYRVYGVSLATSYPFTSPLPTCADPPDLSFALVDEPAASHWDRQAPLFQSPRLLEDGRPRLFVYDGSGYHVLRFTDVADFYLWPDRIECQLHDPDYEFMIEMHLLGLVFSLWLALSGILALHASAVAVEDVAVGFLASNQGGKTSLAAALSQLGHGILTDDVLAIRRTDALFVAAPGFPQMRMWPDLAEHFFGPTPELQLYHPGYDKLRVPVGPDGVGSFCREPRRLQVLYLPDRATEATAVEIEPVASSAAVIELIRNTFGILSVEVLGRQSERLEFIATMLGQVPVRRLAFPSGLDRLPAVADAILADLGQL